MNDGNDSPNKLKRRTFHKMLFIKKYIKRVFTRIWKKTKREGHPLIKDAILTKLGN